MKEKGEREMQTYRVDSVRSQCIHMVSAYTKMYCMLECIMIIRTCTHVLICRLYILIFVYIYIYIYVSMLHTRTNMLFASFVDACIYIIYYYQTCVFMDCSFGFIVNHSFILLISRIRGFQLAIFCIISGLILGLEDYEWIPAYGHS